MNECSKTVTRGCTERQRQHFKIRFLLVGWYVQHMSIISFPLMFNPVVPKLFLSTPLFMIGTLKAPRPIILVQRTDLTGFVATTVTLLFKIFKILISTR